ncbi:unnamed protein product [Toxocara canis]|uniref:Secreted protein n=1 Tax=Toxocara canis TaxID=6265 RepID=A0A183UXB7_TOXCA|nr:unnamed protein product [Toxocara canis]
MVASRCGTMGIMLLVHAPQREPLHHFKYATRIASARNTRCGVVTRTHKLSRFFDSLRVHRSKITAKTP